MWWTILAIIQFLGGIFCLYLALQMAIAAIIFVRKNWRHFFQAPRRSLRPTRWVDKDIVIMKMGPAFGWGDDLPSVVLTETITPGLYCLYRDKSDAVRRYMALTDRTVTTEFPQHVGLVENDFLGIKMMIEH